MQGNPASEIIRLIATLAEMFGRKMTKDALKLYCLGLRGLTAADIEAAIVKALEVCEFMPPPAKLRELAGATSGNTSAEDIAVLAWAEVDRATAYGSYKSIDFADPLINATVRSLGGWPELLSRPTAEFDTWVRKDFIKTYCAFLRAGRPSAEACAPLPGIGDASGTVKRTDGKFVEYTRPAPIRIETSRKVIGIAHKPRSDETARPSLTQAIGIADSTVIKEA